MIPADDRQQPHGQRSQGLDEALYQALYLWRQYAEPQHRRNSVEPIIGHMKHEGLLDRYHLCGREGDRVHSVLCVVGFNLRKILCRLVQLFGLQFVRGLLATIHQSGTGVPGSTPQLKPATA
ncbi:hypothetical protein [Salicola sp. Rm-C-2C1-2]|uniref:hypothetical protein n=1 Tax=Salicola sp. Rm-C-2C1-2 TaxID=3141321 RepID=UPI0032E37B36